MKARLSEKERQVRQEIFDVCEQLYASGLTKARDYPLARVRNARLAQFGKGGHFNTVARYKNEWLEKKDLVTAENESSPITLSTGHEPVVQTAFETFLEEQTEKIRQELLLNFEEQIAGLEKERDESVSRVGELVGQQSTLKTLLDRKQSEVAGFSVSAKAQTDKAEVLYQENAKLSLELAALTKKIDILETAHEKEWANEQAILYSQLNAAQSKADLMENQYNQEQQSHIETRDRLIHLNERQRVDAMNERVCLEDKLAKQRKQFDVDNARYQNEVGGLASKIKELEAHCNYLKKLVSQIEEKAVSERQSLFDSQHENNETLQKALVEILKQHQEGVKNFQDASMDCLINKADELSVSMTSLQKDFKHNARVMQKALS